MIIKVTVQARSSNEKIEEMGIDEYKVWVTSPPTEGQANDDTIALLSDYFNVAPSLIRIKSGNKSSHKLVEIDI